jgi:hypothetical protein
MRSLVDVDTKRLDDIPEIEAMDYLKIDVQGSEMLVFEKFGAEAEGLSRRSHRDDVRADVRGPAVVFQAGALSAPIRFAGA